MNHFHLLSLICILLFLPFLVSGQSDIDVINKELKALDGSLYISHAIKRGELLATKGSHKDAKDLFNKAVKKSKSLGDATQAVVLLTKAELMLDHFPLNQKNLKEIAKTVDQSLKKDKSMKMVQDAKKIYTKISSIADSKLNIDDRIAKLNEVIEKADKKIAEANEKLKVNGVIIKSKESAAIEIVQLRKERMRLENVTAQLTQSVDINEERLKKRQAMIRRMSRDQSKKEAVIQFNKRIIDSLEFGAKLDSISILNNQHLISDQNSKLELQQAELKVKDAEIDLKSSQQRLYVLLSILGLILAGFLSFVIFVSRRANKRLKAHQEALQIEKDRAEKLLLNILPEFIALELKEKSKVETRMINQCTVMFTDFINFTHISKQLSPKALIDTLDECFREFDKISTEFNVEKIKTIGDSYMCAAGVPVASETHAHDTVKAAMKMIEFLDVWNAEREKNNKIRFDARFGIHSGPVIAGVVGMKKFAYDIWGDTVNIAARIESQSSAQRINISSSTHKLINGDFKCENRGNIAVKNMSDLKMYYVDKPSLKSA